MSEESNSPATAELTAESLAPVLYDAAWKSMRADGQIAIRWEDIINDEPPRPDGAAATERAWLATAQAAIDALGGHQ